MGNQDKEIGLNYVSKTFYELADFITDHGEEGQEDEPLKFKIYKDVEYYALRQALPLQLGDMRWSFPEFRQHAADAPAATTFTYELLSTLLYYTFGFSRHDTGNGAQWPFHRLVPSARCFFPTELYLWIPQMDSRPAGIYHYDNLHHRLALLRAGDYRDMLGDIMGADLTESSCILFVSAYFWKMAFRYRNFAYRLCSQEAGMVVGNALLVTGTLGLQSHVHYQFLDTIANQLLGFEPVEEHLMAVVPLYLSTNTTSQIHIRPGKTTQQDYSQSIEPIHPRFLKRANIDVDICNLLVDISQNSFMESKEEFVTNFKPSFIACKEEETLGYPPPLVSQTLELEQALHQRHSGDMMFSPLHQSLSQDIFWEIIRYSTSAYTCDLSSDGANPAAQLHIMVNRVDGIQPGIYRLCHQCKRLHTVELRDLDADTRFMSVATAVNYTNVNMLCFVTANYHTMSSVLGNRSYRIMSMESGIIAQRLCTISGAFGLAARCADNYSVQLSEHILKLTGTQTLPAFLISIAQEQPGAMSGLRFRHAIRF